MEWNGSSLHRIETGAGLLWILWIFRAVKELLASQGLYHRQLKKKVKVKWSRYSPGVAQRVGRVIALLFHDRGTRSGWVVSSTPRPNFTPEKDPVPILQEAGWAPEPDWTGGKSRPHRDLIPDRPSRSSVAIPTELPGPLLYTVNWFNYAAQWYDTVQRWSTPVDSTVSRHTRTKYGSPPLRKPKFGVYLWGSSYSSRQPNVRDQQPTSHAANTPEHGPLQRACAPRRACTFCDWPVW